MQPAGIGTLAPVLAAPGLASPGGAQAPLAVGVAAAGEHQLGNASLPPEFAADLLRQAEAATEPGLLTGVTPPALFLGSNQSNNQLAYGDACELFVSQGHYSPSAHKYGCVFAFRDESGVQLAERLPASRRGRWKGSFGGRPTDVFKQPFGIDKKNSTTFKRTDGSLKLTMHKFESGTCRLLHLFKVEETPAQAQHAAQQQQQPRVGRQQQQQQHHAGWQPPQQQRHSGQQQQPPPQQQQAVLLAPLAPQPAEQGNEMLAMFDRFCNSPSPGPAVEAEIDALLLHINPPGSVHAAEKRVRGSEPGASGSGSQRRRQVLNGCLMPIPERLHDMIGALVGAKYRHFRDIQAGSSTELQLTPASRSTHVCIRGEPEAIDHAKQLLQRHFDALSEQAVRSVSMPQRSLHVLCGSLRAGGRFVQVASTCTGPHVDLNTGWQPPYALVPAPPASTPTADTGVDALSAQLSSMVVQQGNSFLLDQEAALRSLDEDMGTACLPGHTVKLRSNLGTQRFGDAGPGKKYKACRLVDLGSLSLERLQALKMHQDMRTYFDNGVPASTLPALRERLSQLGFAPRSAGSAESHAVVHLSGSPSASCTLPRTSITFAVTGLASTDPALITRKVKILGRKISFLTFLHGDCHPDVRFKTVSQLADGTQRPVDAQSEAAVAWAVADGCHVGTVTASGAGGGLLSKLIQLDTGHARDYIIHTVRFKRKEVHERTVQQATQRVTIKRAEQDGGERWEVSLRCRLAAGAAGSSNDRLACTASLLAMFRELRSALHFDAAT